MTTATANEFDFVCREQQEPPRVLFSTRPGNAASLLGALLLAVLSVFCAHSKVLFPFELTIVFLASVMVWGLVQEENFSVDGGTLRIEYCILGIPAATATVIRKRDIQEVVLQDKGPMPVFAFYCAGGKIIETRLSPPEDMAKSLLRHIRVEVRTS